MKKVLFLVLALTGLGVAAPVALAPAAQAQGYYDDDNAGPPRYGRYDERRYSDRYDRPYRPYRHYYKPRPKSDGCKALIRASGLGNVLPGIARINAIRAWQREVRAVYGRSFSWNAAKANSVTCEPYGISTRCTAKARPCF